MGLNNESEKIEDVEERVDLQIKRISRFAKLMSIVFVMTMIFNAVLMLISKHPFILIIATSIIDISVMIAFYYLIKINYKERTIEGNNGLYKIIKMFIFGFMASLLFPISITLLSGTTPIDDIVTLLYIALATIFFSILLGILLDVVIGHIFYKKNIIHVRSIAKIVINFICIVAGIFISYYFFNALILLKNTGENTSFGGVFLLVWAFIFIMCEIVFYSVGHLIIHGVAKGKKKQTKNN